MRGHEAGGAESKRPTVLAISLLAVAGALGAGLVLAGLSATRSDPSGIDAVRARAVGIRAGGCSLVDGLGSGFIVDEGKVLTSAHVVAGATDVRVVVDGVELAASVDAFDPDADLALLRAEVDGDPVVVQAAPVESDVSILAWTPDGGVEAIPSTVARRLLVTIEDINLQGRTEREAIEVATGVARGVSGAGVVDADGHLVGIIYASSRERQASFAIDAPLLGELIETADGDPTPNGRCP
ncbi:MAG: trypsin-like peptidase domain-containing protein [Actinomycetia bacterium]|nr:trypsin-like peptidase domain-containing protein [Actinomycetes bacterium]